MGRLVGTGMVGGLNKRRNLGLMVVVVASAAASVCEEVVVVATLGVGCVPVVVDMVASASGNTERSLLMICCPNVILYCPHVTVYCLYVIVYYPYVIECQNQKSVAVVVVVFALVKVGCGGCPYLVVGVGFEVGSCP